MRISNIHEQAMRASKWLKCPMLLDVEEMKDLMAALGHFLIYHTSSITKPGEELMAHEAFLECYHAYVQALQEGTVCDPALYRKAFSSVWTMNAEAMYVIPISPEQQLVRVYQPVVQLRPHYMDVSPLDGKFRSMTFGSQTISWGIQFSYPQLYENPETHEPEQVKSQFPNTALFQNIQKWMRANTTPTPFLLKEEKINIPMRIGKKCMPWINQHPQFSAKGLRVEH